MWQLVVFFVLINVQTEEFSKDVFKYPTLYPSKKMCESDSVKRYLTVQFAIKEMNRENPEVQVIYNKVKCKQV